MPDEQPHPAFALPQGALGPALVRHILEQPVNAAGIRFRVDPQDPPGSTRVLELELARQRRPVGQALMEEAHQLAATFGPHDIPHVVQWRRRRPRVQPEDPEALLRPSPPGHVLVQLPAADAGEALNVLHDPALFLQGPGRLLLVLEILQGDQEFFRFAGRLPADGQGHPCPGLRPSRSEKAHLAGQRRNFMTQEAALQFIADRQVGGMDQVPLPEARDFLGPAPHEQAEAPVGLPPPAVQPQHGHPDAVLLEGGLEPCVCLGHLPPDPVMDQSEEHAHDHEHPSREQVLRRGDQP